MQKPNGKPPSLKERLLGTTFVNVMAATITAVWAFSTVVDALSATYEANPLIHTVMLSVAGGLFGVGLIRKNN